MRQKYIFSKNIVLFFQLVIISAMLLLFSGGISGNDFWWHIKVGEYIHNYKTIPTNDIFSWYGTKNNIAWTAHEWLSDLILFHIFNLFGDKGVWLFCFLLSCLMFCLLWHEARECIGKNFVFCVVFFLMFAIVENLFFYGRPQIFGYFCLYAELKALTLFYNNKSEISIYFVPLITILWSGLHGGSAALAYVLCFIFFVFSMFDFKIGKIQCRKLGINKSIKLLAVFFATCGAIFVNPIGVKVFVYPFESLGDKLSMSVISEWSAPDAKNFVILVLFFVPIFALIMCAVITYRRIRAIDIVVTALFVYLFFRSSRFIIYWYISAPFFAFDYIPELQLKIQIKKRERIALSICTLLVIVLNLSIVCDVMKNNENSQLISTVISENAVEAIKEDSPKRIFNDYNIGETLIYNGIPVFFDSRADLYSKPGIMADGTSLMHLNQTDAKNDKKYINVDKMIEKYDFDAIAILTNRALYSYVISHPEKFRPVYEDDTVGYFRIISAY